MNLIGSAKLMATINVTDVYAFVDEVVFMLVTMIEYYLHRAYK